MGKKGNKFQSEEDVYNYIISNIESWRKKKTWIYSNKGFLSSIPRRFRTPKIWDLIYNNSDVFNTILEYKNLPPESISEDGLIKFAFDAPRLFWGQCASNVFSDNQITFPVLVAYELSKRRVDIARFKNRASYGLDYYYNFLGYPRKALNYLRTIRRVADNVEDYFIDDIDFEKFSAFNSNKLSESLKEDFMSILKICTDEEKFETEEYNTKYEKVQPKDNKKLVLLIGGNPDSGKTTLSNSLEDRIKGAKHFDFDRFDINYSVEQIFKNTRDVSVAIFSEPDIIRGYDNIKQMYPDANVLKIYVRPENIRTMTQNSKFRKNRFVDEEYAKRIREEEARYTQLADFVVSNDYTSNGLNRMCDEVISTIIERYRCLEEVDDSRPTSDDLKKALGEVRIENGAERINTKGIIGGDVHDIE